MWVKYSATFYKEFSDNFYIYFNSNDASGAEFYVDDVSVVELDEASPSTNIVTIEASNYETGAY